MVKPLDVNEMVMFLANEHELYARDDDHELWYSSMGEYQVIVGGKTIYTGHSAELAIESYNIGKQVQETHKWDRLITKKLLDHGLAIEQAGIVVGMIAEERQLADRQGWKRGFECGFEEANKKQKDTK